MSLRHVAAQAGVTAGMVQHYFPSKDAMLTFAMGAASDRYEARLTSALTALGDAPAPRAVVLAVLTALIPVDQQQAQDARVGLAFRSYASRHPPAGEHLRSGDAQLRDYLAGVLRDAATIGDAVQHATALLALAEGLGIQVLTSGLGPDDAMDALARHADLVLDSSKQSRRTLGSR